MQNKPFQSLAAHLSLWIISLGALIFIAVLSTNYFFSRQLLENYVEQLAKETVLSTVQKVDTVLHSISTSANSLAAVVTIPDISKKHIKQMAKAFVENNAEIFGMAVALESGAISTSGTESDKNFAPYFYRKDRHRLRRPSSDLYDYKNRRWYRTQKSSTPPSGRSHTLMTAAATCTWSPTPRPSTLRTAKNLPGLPPPTSNSAGWMTLFRNQKSANPVSVLSFPKTTSSSLILTSHCTCGRCTKPTSRRKLAKISQQQKHFIRRLFLYRLPLPERALLGRGKNAERQRLENCYRTTRAGTHRRHQRPHPEDFSHRYRGAGPSILCHHFYHSCINQSPSANLQRRPKTSVPASSTKHCHNPYETMKSVY